jgi:lipopolysaccharide/colanic/teichoic acid biosynthesis glycosyltransferase
MVSEAILSPLPDDLRMISLVEQHQSSWYLHAKALLDVCLAVVLLILFTPLILFAMLLVKLTSRGPAIYSQTRLGLQGKPFTIYKIRTMRHQCESLTGAQWSKPGDSRITSTGKFLRKTHLDELPQLWNVLRGDMSLVGPRPERPEFVPQLEKAIPLYRTRLLVRPGVTGLAQVQLPPDTDLDSVRLKLAYDIHYVRQVNFWLDIRLIVATAGKMFGLSFATMRWLLGFPRMQLLRQEYVELLHKYRKQGDSTPMPAGS